MVYPLDDDRDISAVLSGALKAPNCAASSRDWNRASRPSSSATHYPSPSWCASASTASDASYRELTDVGTSRGTQDDDEEDDLFGPV